jgi:prophage regulatory protein
MRVIIDWKKLKELVPYSRQHIARLEAAGTFPLRRQLSQSRVGWFADEIEAWIESRPARKPHTSE